MSGNMPSSHRLTPGRTLKINQLSRDIDFLALHPENLALTARNPAEATMPDWVNCQQGVT